VGHPNLESIMPNESHDRPEIAFSIAVFPILADAIDVKRGDQLCETVFQPSTQPDKVVRPMGSRPRPCLDFDHIGRSWEDSKSLS